jgi:hypothetical protein
LVLTTEEEIAAAREQTLEVLQDILQREGKSPFEVVGHYGSNLTENQVRKLREWLGSLKEAVS